MFHLSEEIENRLAPTPSSEEAGGEAATTGDDVRFFEKLRSVDPVRRRKLIRLRESIRGGSYLSEDKLRTALDRLQEKEL